jgi:hypothetical protein
MYVESLVVSMGESCVYSYSERTHGESNKSVAFFVWLYSKITTLFLSCNVHR